MKDSEERYRLLLRNLQAVVYKGYVNCEVDFIDEKVEELTGYDKIDFDTRKLKWDDLLVSEDFQRFRQAFLKGLHETGSYLRDANKKKDGEVIWVQDRGQIICDLEGKVEYVSGVFFDVTERRHAEEALKVSEERFASFMRHLRHHGHARL